MRLYILLHSSRFFLQTSVALGVQAVLIETYVCDPGAKFVRENWPLWPPVAFRGWPVVDSRGLPLPPRRTIYIVPKFQV